MKHEARNRRRRKMAERALRPRVVRVTSGAMVAMLFGEGSERVSTERRAMMEWSASRDNRQVKP